MPGPARMSRSLVVLLAFVCGSAAANIYYVQPLLNEIARSFHVGSSTAALLVACSQLGFLTGLALLVPVGDLRERRRLLTTVLLLAAVAATACAAAPALPFLAVALLALGVVAVAAQITVPLASALAGEEERGAVVGMVMSGLLIGILTARTVSGLVAEVGGWRMPFVLAAVLMVVLAAVVRRRLPEVPATEDLPYPDALRSVLGLVRSEPVLRQRMLLGSLQFGCFSILWASLALLLGEAPYDYGEGAIGLFGLAGLAGAGVAPLSGRLADRGHGQLVQTGLLVLLLISWGVLALGTTSVVAVLAGIVLLDLAVQGAHINNQSAIYSLNASARSRLTGAYMTAVFTGGTVGSLLSALLYSMGGWEAVCGLGAVFSVTGLGVWLASEAALRRRRERTAAERPATA